MTKDFVFVIGDTECSGWENININSSIFGIAASFNLNVFENSKNTEVIEPGQLCRIIYKGTLKLTGYIEKIRVNKTGDTESVTIEGRSILCDLVDCCPDIPKQYKDITVNELISKIVNSFGLDVMFKQSLNPSLKQFTIETGETAFSVIDKLCRLCGAFTVGYPEGVLVIMDSEFDINEQSLIAGKNISDFTISRDMSNVFHKYKALTQSKSLLADITTKEEAIDHNIRKERVLELIPSSGENLANLVNNTAKIRQAKSLNVTVGVIGWNYSLAECVGFGSDYIDGEFVISELNESFSTDSGTKASLSLVLKDSLLVNKKEIKQDSGGL